MAAGGNASEGNGPPEKGGARWGRTTALVPLSIFGLFVLMIFVGSGMLAQGLSYLWPTVYYTEVFADVTAEGQRYQLTSTAKCTLRAKARFWGLVGGPPPAAIDGGLLVKRLPSGAGLMIIGPALCSKHDLYKFIHKEKFARDTSVRTVDLEKYLDFLKSRGGRPFVYFLDNAEKPTKIIGYWKEYVTRPGADLQIHSIRYRRKEPGWLEWPDIPEPEKELPWLKGRELTNRHGQRRCNGNRAGWLGFYLDVIKEEAWSKYDEFSIIYERNEIIEIEYGNITDKLNYGQKLYETSVKRYNISVDQKEMLVLMNKFDPFIDGSIEYFPVNKFSIKPACEHRFYFRINGSNIKNNQNWMYDPNMKIIFRLHSLPFGKHKICR